MEKEKNEADINKARKEVDRVLELLSLCNNSNTPDLKARKELQTLVENTEVARALMEKQEGMYATAIRTRIEGFQGTDAYKEVLYVKCNQLKVELGYSHSNQLERLAIEQIVICWLNYHETDIKHAHITSKSQTLELAMFWEKRLTLTIRRYNRALELLSRMRKMNLVVQVNNANNQIVNNGNN